MEINVNVDIKYFRIRWHLDKDEKSAFAFGLFIFIFIFFMHVDYTVMYLLYCSRTIHILFIYCLQDPQLLYSEKKKNGSHDTTHTFKNYFATVFSVFSKISGIQTNP